ncbi:MAG: hypothetical protein LAT78_06330 [Roseinatronobacter sp.]|nr:hypothetical protein [Roseinatronobacter sp.]
MRDRSCMFSVVMLDLFGISSAGAQTMPPGAAASGCNVSQFAPIMSERTG